MAVNRKILMVPDFTVHPVGRQKFLSKLSKKSKGSLCLYTPLITYVGKYKRSSLYLPPFDNFDKSHLCYLKPLVKLIRFLVKNLKAPFAECRITKTDISDLLSEWALVILLLRKGLAPARPFCLYHSQ